MGTPRRLFPERQIFIRTLEGSPRFIRLTPGVQKAAATAALAAVGAVAWLAVSQVTLERITDLQSDEMRRIEETYHRILESIGTSTPAPVFSEHQDRIPLSAGEITADVKRRIADLERRLAESEAGRRLATSERDKLEVERKRLATSAAAMEKRINESHAAQQEAVKQLINRAKTAVDRASRHLSQLGLDPDRILATEARRGRSAALGGPFIEFERVPNEPVPDGLRMLNDHIGRLSELRRVMAAMPVGTPVRSRRVVSPYGVRRDPFNGRLAMHNGIDLGAPAGMPVYSRADGRVTFAGRSGPYGNLVEVEHAFGIRTRYGHLSAVVVEEGQHLPVRGKIGEVGSTGRSTAPHLHYEVTLNGRTLNPKRFVEAKQHVFQDESARER